MTDPPICLEGFLNSTSARSPIADLTLGLCPFLTDDDEARSLQPNPIAIAQDNQAEAVLLDLVNPVGVRRDLSPASRDARCVR